MRGPHWHSGQEAALRLVALGWAAVATAGRTSTPGQPRTLALFAAVAAERVAARIEYAESQYNNHSLTEALGLLWGAALVPRHPDAQRWRRIATRVLRRELGRQVFTDGSFVQESIVYERLALEACLTVLWLDRSAGGALLDAQTRAVVTHKAGAMRDYLARMTDPTTNLFSRLGANDGTWLLMPVEDDFWDARPTRAFAESVLGPSPETAPPTPTGLTWSHAADGAFTVLKGGRPGRRPTEADALHVEHRVNGVEVLRDAGSFRYIGPAGLDAWFRSAQAHNTVVVNGDEPLKKLARFLWDTPQRSRIVVQGWGKRGMAWARAEQRAWEASHGVVVTRTVVRAGQDLIVVDALTGTTTPQTLLASWHLGEVWRLGAATGEAGGHLVPLSSGTANLFFWCRALSGSVALEAHESLQSRHYAQCALAPVLRVETTGTSPVVLVTSIADRPLVVHDAEGGASLDTAVGRVRVRASGAVQFD
jgi:hypothetical protein